MLWYSDHGRGYLWRNASATIYVRIVSEVLLQRTRADTVQRFAPDFFREYPSWKHLADATETELQERLKTIGLWRQKARSLSQLAQVMAKRAGRFPRSREDIQALPNVGQYIANAVLLFRFQQPEPLLDSNMARVIERYFGQRKLADVRFDPYLQSLAKRIVQYGGCPALTNWAILDLGALVCRPSKPLCSKCPLSKECTQFQASSSHTNAIKTDESESGRTRHRTTPKTLKPSSATP